MPDSAPTLSERDIRTFVAEFEGREGCELSVRDVIRFGQLIRLGFRSRILVDGEVFFKKEVLRKVVGEFFGDDDSELLTDVFIDAARR